MASYSLDAHPHTQSHTCSIYPFTAFVLTYTRVTPEFCRLVGTLALREDEECVLTKVQPSGGMWYLLQGRDYVWTVDVYDDKQHLLTHDVCLLA